MQICLNNADLKEWDGEVLIIGILEGNLKEQLISLEERLEGSLIKALEEKNFSGKKDETTTFEFLKGNPSTLILIGMGEASDLRLNDLRNAAAKAARSCPKRKEKIGIKLPWELFDQNFSLKAIGEAIRLSIFKDNRFKSNQEESQAAKKFELINVDKKFENSLSEVEAICSGVEIARELVGAPPNILTPLNLSEIAKSIAKEHGLKAKIMDKAACERLGMGAYLAVSQGSDLEPKFIHLTYTPAGNIKKRIALVGKGLTFDSGGYNLKVGASQIELMKFDMGGSAAVLGAAKAIGAIKPKDIEVHFIVAACENMVNGSAVHPGDIVKASNGKTIEINNTDAEGRLTLADALVYASNQKPDAIVDLATLTGACVIALGDEIAGLWTDSDQLAEDLEQAAESSGEGLWRMPMQSSYKEGLKSMLADIKNTGPRQGGSITAALFLKEFIQENIQWAHIDIAGTVWSEKDKGINVAGATGYGVRTLVTLVCNYKYE